MTESISEAVARAVTHLRSENRLHPPWKLMVTEQQFTDYQERFGIPASAMLIVPPLGES